MAQNEAVAALRDHVATKVRNAATEWSPFPHVVIAEFFPADVYAGIVRHNPFREEPGSEWLSREQSGNVTARTPYYARKQIDVTAGIRMQSEDGTALWEVVRASFLEDAWFERLLMKKYAEYFALRFGDLVREPDFLSLLSRAMFVQRHEPGFDIGPHTDLPTRILTCIFSFADRPGFEEYGTQLLAHRDRLTRCWGTDHHLRDDFVVRKIAPYAPNSALVFLKTRHSFHAVPHIDERVPNQRYGMQFQMHEPPDGVFRDLSAPRLMHFTR